MQLYAIYNKNKGPASERAWYGDSGDYYYYTGWPTDISRTPSFNLLTKLSKAFEVAGAHPSSQGKAYAVRDEKYYDDQMRLQYGDGDMIPGVHHTVPKIKVAAIFTDENEAKTAYPKAEIRAYDISW